MSEDEHIELVGGTSETHSGLRKIAFKLRWELPTNAPVLKEALKAEERVFRLKGELKHLDITDPELPHRRKVLPEVRRGDKAINIKSLWR